MKTSLALLGAALAAFPAPRPAHDDDTRNDTWDVLGIELSCGDPQRAAAFYQEVLGYELVRANDRGAILRLGELYLVLDGTREPPAAEPSALAYLNHRVADLKVAALEVEQHGGRMLLAEPQAFVLGHSLSFLDPEGNRGNLVRLTDETEPAERLPQIFNLSLRAPGAAELEGFFCDVLGFEVYTRSYLPRTLPLAQRGSAMLVIHPSAEDAPQEDTPRGCGAAILMASPPDRPGTQRSSVWFGQALALSGPGGLEVLGVDRAAFECALESEEPR